ncbi:hypothetical protein [Acanthopleuribacter pedis]|uniref:Uncharacterized protein n=1 Tax=Acanthopleuribacter pedis TaxID=442870 RepID=A0A8J7U5E1_9BACT|nr:hypothetical protein [Acanthopleuribacter pedis]MBO1320759.1 hypothetical protein [Acanthopleuribacter pedis]
MAERKSKRGLEVDFVLVRREVVAVMENRKSVARKYRGGGVGAEKPNSETVVVPGSGSENKRAGLPSRRPIVGITRIRATSPKKNIKIMVFPETRWFIGTWILEEGLQGTPRRTLTAVSSRPPSQQHFFSSKAFREKKVFEEKKCPH